MTAAVAEPVAAPAAASPSAVVPSAPVVAPAAVAPAGAPAAGAGGGVVAGAPAASATATPAAAAPTRLLANTEPAKPAATDGAPAKVEDAKPADWTLKAPEGATLSADDLKAAETFAKEAGLSQAQAEKLLAREVSGRAAAQAAQHAEAEKVGDAWLAEAKAHPEIGGDKLDGAVANAKRALTAFATVEERKAIAESPFANNPMFLAILNRAAKALPAEDVTHVSTGAPVETNPARILYPHLR